MFRGTRPEYPPEFDDSEVCPACGLELDGEPPCQCEECPKCGEMGDPHCYGKHLPYLQSQLGAICRVYGIEGPAECLRSIDKYGDHGGTVSVLLQGEGRTLLGVPSDLHKIRKLPDATPVRAWLVHGIAWDGSDWEYSEELERADEVPAALERFSDALNEHRVLADEDYRMREVKRAFPEN